MIFINFVTPKAEAEHELLFNKPTNRPQDMFSNFCKVKNHKNVNNLATPQAREKTNIDLESLEFYKLLDCV